MTSLRRSAFLVLALAAVTLLAACAGSRSAADSNLAAKVASTATIQAPVKTATALVNGKSETILTASNGLTLYYRTIDKPPSEVCSDGCAKVWHPLLFKGTPPAAAGLHGKLTTQTTANGSQVEYNGHPLYAYSGDHAPGQTNGEGKGGVWHVATPGLK
jgi:predicted lipoprotein with Yx(FWY)xxD motif